MPTETASELHLKPTPIFLPMNEYVFNGFNLSSYRQGCVIHPMFMGPFMLAIAEQVSVGIYLHTCPKAMPFIVTRWPAYLHSIRCLIIMVVIAML